MGASTTDQAVGDEWTALGCFEGYIKNHWRICPNSGVFNTSMAEGDEAAVKTCCVPLYNALYTEAHREASSSSSLSFASALEEEGGRQLKILLYRGDEKHIAPEKKSAASKLFLKDEEDDDEQEGDDVDEGEEEDLENEKGLVGMKKMIFRSSKMFVVESSLTEGSETISEAFFLIYDAVTNHLLGSMDRRVSKGMAMILEHCDDRFQFVGFGAGLHPSFDCRKNVNRTCVKSLPFKVLVKVKKDFNLDGAGNSIRDMFCRPKNYFLRRGIKWLKRQFSRLKGFAGEEQRKYAGDYWTAGLTVDHILSIGALPSDTCLENGCKFKHCKMKHVPQVDSGAS
eukprot:TRINITY_DN5672_c0_g3_i1.p1 TRINITY_DN5672_c0_g3~~TRINITY_DN5672_c0_g3_i1.p1  ORF type:complete len:340 (-),score=111.03 TRINITY_DN5672_c0_g3_i1:41-1060(-)